MTKNEARDILAHHNLWRRGKEVNMVDMIKLGQAIDAVCEPNSIAQSIRDAAIYDTGLPELEWHICEAFAPFESWLAVDDDARTFMLLVAEALE